MFVVALSALSGVPGHASPGVMRAVLERGVSLDRSDFPQGRKLASLRPVHLDAGESRFVYGRLRARNTSARNVEQQVGVSCDGTPGGLIRTSRNNEGRDRRTSGGWGILVIDVRYLFTAPVSGTYVCALWGRSSAESLTALPHGTLIQMSREDDRGSKQWLQQPCDSRGRVAEGPADRTGSRCEYLVHSRVKQRGTAYPDRGYALVEDLYVADPGARALQVIADLQLTTCYRGTNSCIDAVDRYGAPHGSRGVVDTRLEVYQLDAAGGTTLCRATKPARLRRTVISAHAHHLKIRHQVVRSVRADAGCTPRFMFRVYVRSVSGDPIKIVGMKTDGLVSTQLAFSNGIVRLVA